MTTHDDTAGLPENPYATEAQQRWGHTDAWKQSQERTKKLTKADWARIKEAGDALMREFVAASDAGKDPASPEVRALTARHYAGLRTFYEPNLELYRGLADMYVSDARFMAFYDTYKPGLAGFMQKAMHAFCDAGGEGK